MTEASATGFGLVVPLYEEEQRLGEYGQELVDFVCAQPSGSELLFVDDGSSDATTDLVEALIRRNRGAPVRLLRRPHAGKGATVAAGLQATDAPFRGFCDLDLSTPLPCVERILAAARRAEVLAIGSRDLAASNLVEPEGSVREALGRTYNRLLQATITPGVSDTQCGAKVASGPVWERLLPWCREPGFAWDAELVAVARALGVPVQEVPIDWRHDERSKVRVVRDGVAMVAATPRIWRLTRRVAMTTRRRGEAGGVFDADNADLLMGADQDHWWFRSKAALVATAIRRTGGRRGGGWLVDVGAGAGGVTALLGWDPSRVLVVEGSAALATSARRRHGLASVQATVDSLPLPARSADVVCLLDVIEHLEDPGAALRQAVDVLGPDGRLIVNVPAHDWLWSEADTFLGHVRRYTRPALRAELAAAGLEPILLTHVFSWLVPPVWVTRRRSADRGPELGLDRTSPAIDRAAMVLTALERALVGRAGLPFGTSVLCVAQKAGT